jgi:hypothetical protein
MSGVQPIAAMSKQQRKRRRAAVRAAAARFRKNHPQTIRQTTERQTQRKNLHGLADKKYRETQATLSEQGQQFSLTNARGLRRPTFIIQSPTDGTHREVLDTEGPTDPIAADPTPLPHRSRRETAILEAIVAAYDPNATLEQIAEQILSDPASPWRFSR